MSYIVRAGNLAAPPTLHVSDRTGRSYARARVIVSDMRRDPETGTWNEIGKQGYAITVHGDAAKRLTDAAERCGNVRVLFAGTLTVRDYTREDGTTGSSHDVDVDEIGISLQGQTITVERGRRA